MNTKDLVLHEEYNFKNQPERLKYVGKEGAWHQFEKIGGTGVWAEVLDEDLWMIEKTIVNVGTEGHCDFGDSTLKKQGVVTGKCSLSTKVEVDEFVISDKEQLTRKGFDVTLSFRHRKGEK